MIWAFIDSLGVTVEFRGPLSLARRITLGQARELRDWLVKALP